ncbi:MAG: hypothetical protein ACM3X6_11480 [Patescibacteria group bacterium]
MARVWLDGRLVRAETAGVSVFRLTLSRGEGPRGLDPAAAVRPGPVTREVMVWYRSQAAARPAVD